MGTSAGRALAPPEGVRQVLVTLMTDVWARSDWRRQVRSPLVIALLVSILLHLYLWLMALLFAAALKNGWLPPWLAQAVRPVAALVDKQAGQTEPAKPREQWQEIPLQFVEVDPAQASDQAPDDSKFYSTANTLAANPNPTKSNKPDPRIDGQREDTFKTFETLRPNPKPQPAPPKPEEIAETPEPAKKPLPAKPAQQPVESEPVKPGETLLAKVNPEAKPVTAPTTEPPRKAQEPQEAQEYQRPRPQKSVNRVRADKGMLVAPLMKQDGGVERSALQSSLSVKASPLGDYNYQMIIAVQNQWYRFLEDRNFALERSGRVTITFDLHSDGTVTEVQTKDSNVGDALSFLCEMAVMQPAPFGKWPADVRRIIGSDTIPVTFTFNYY